MGPLGISHLVDILLLRENKTVTQEDLPPFIDPEGFSYHFESAQQELYSPTPHFQKSQLSKSAIRLIPKTCSPSYVPVPIQMAFGLTLY